MENEYKKKLKMLMDSYTHLVYRVTVKFPRIEKYGIVSQLRRAALSIILNYIEGFARRKPKVILNFYETAYGSLQESKYLTKFSFEEGFISEKDYLELKKLEDEIAPMLWTELNNLSQSLD